MTPTLEIFDPRVGKTWETKDDLTGHTFSTARHPFLVVYSTMLEWSNHRPLLEELLAQTSDRGFVAVEPWHPNEQQIITGLKSSLGGVLEFNHSAISEFAVGQNHFHAAFEIRANFGGWNSGIWCFGGRTSEFSQPQRLSYFKADTWGLPHILRQPEKIGFVLELGEMHQSTLITQLYSGVDDFLVRLQQSARCQ